MVMVNVELWNLFDKRAVDGVVIALVDRIIIISEFLHILIIVR